MLNPTPLRELVDERGLPYFIPKLGVTLEEFQRSLADPEADDRIFLLEQLLQKARPDDVFSFVSLGEIVEAWPLLEGSLGDRETFWAWLLEVWWRLGLVRN